MSEWSTAKSHEYASESEYDPVSPSGSINEDKLYACDYEWVDGIGIVHERYVSGDLVDEETDQNCVTAPEIPGISKLPEDPEPPVPGISKLPEEPEQLDHQIEGQFADMGKNAKVAYEVRKKFMPGTSHFLTAIIPVKEGENSGVIHRRICEKFKGNQANIRGLDNKDEVDNAWKNLKEDIEDKVLTEVEMPALCWQKLQNTDPLTFEEFKEMMKERQPPEPAAKDPPTSHLKEKKEKKESKHGAAANPEKAAEGKKETAIQSGSGLESKAVEAPIEEKSIEVEQEKPQEKLIWSFVEPDGSYGQRYVLDDDMEKEMIAMLAQKDKSAPVQFLLNCGMLLIPSLQKENSKLREKIRGLEDGWAKTKEELQIVTADRDKRVKDLMEMGSKQVGELAKAVKEKERAEVNTEALKEQVKTMNELVAKGVNFEKILARLEKMEEILKKTEEKADDAKRNTEHIVNMVGTKKERQLNFFTPALESMASIDPKVILVGHNSFFLAVKSHRSLKHDLDLAVNKSVITMVEVEAEGMELSNEIYTKQSEWSEESQLILIIDGVESADPTLISTFINMALVAKRGRRTLVVAGPSSDEQKEKKRQEVLDKLVTQNITTLNMSEVARKANVEISKFEQGGVWSALASAYFFSMVSWWVGNVKSNGQSKPDPTICIECGFVHEEDKECLKEEITRAGNQLGKTSRKEEKNATKERSTNRNNNNNNNNNSNSNENKRKCHFCGKGHPPPCWHEKDGGSAYKKLKSSK